MKIGINSIKYLGYEEIFKLPIDKLTEKIGAQIGAMDEDPFYLGGLYEGIVVVKVVSCEPHGDADKLNVCVIDDGGVVEGVNRDSDGNVQVVCGAPNVKAGMTAAWIPPGVTVPSTVSKEPLVIESREIRGVVSNGMLASLSELAISDDHGGILEIKAEDVGEELMKPGTDFKKLYGLDDYILDIENKMFTHRPDAFGLLGVGREIAGIQGIAFKSPDWYRADSKIEPEADTLKLSFVNELPELVPRFVAIPMSDVKIAPSPIWLQTFLTRHGLRPINNIVDLTNYLMLLTGQPLHAYDYDKLKALSAGVATIVVRNPKPGEKLKLLNGKEIEPGPESIMIATDKKLIGAGGVMGGLETEVDDNTTNIVLEMANFDMYSIRRTSMAHGLFTDAVTRFNKGQSPLQNMAVAAEAVAEVGKITGGKVAGKIVDDIRLDPAVIERNSLHFPVTVPVSFINDRLGLQLTPADVKTILENVEFTVEVNEETLTVKAPFWRTDIELREDIVEEVGRLYGYDKLPLELPIRDLSPTRRDPLFDLKAKVRARLSRAGANEVLTYSFVPAELLQKTGQDSSKAFQVSNAISPELEHYRLSLMPSLLDKVHPNIKAGFDEFAIFELGKTHDLDHIDQEGLPVEFEFTGLVLTAADKLKKVDSAYYEARKYLEFLAGHDLVYKPISQDMMQYPVVQPYEPKRAALVSVKNGNFLGIVGEFKASVTRGLKLPKYTAGFEIDTLALQNLITIGPDYSALFRFPGVKQDITLKVSADLSYDELFNFVKTELKNNAPDNTHTELEGIDIFQKEDDKSHKQVTFRATVTGRDRTLTDKEINGVLDAVAELAKSKISANRI